MMTIEELEELHGELCALAATQVLSTHYNDVCRQSATFIKSIIEGGA
jgi:hypothetical protein